MTAQMDDAADTGITTAHPSRSCRHDLTGTLNRWFTRATSATSATEVVGDGVPDARE